MHVLYIHQNYPAQFGHLALQLGRRRGWRCTFVSERFSGAPDPYVQRIRYRPDGGVAPTTHYASATFESYIRRSAGVYEALKARPVVRPDLIVAHSGFGTSLFLKSLYGDVPIVHHCEWFYRGEEADCNFFRRSPEGGDAMTVRSKARNAMLLADLENCTAGYSPTWWQRSQFPYEYQSKLQTLFDGADVDFWRPDPPTLRELAGKPIPPDKKVVTYVTRGYESMRGFDVFMQVAGRIAERRSDVLFLCIGSDRVCYGSDLQRIQEKSFREHVWKQGAYDPDRFIFSEPVPRDVLRAVFARSDLHVYLTAPFILSWSLFNALACGCTLLASDTQPVREIVQHGVNGLLAPFWHVERFVELACDVLDDSAAYRKRLGQAAVESMQRDYSLQRVLPRMVRMYEAAAAGRFLEPADGMSQTKPAAANGNSKTPAWKDQWKYFRDSVYWKTPAATVGEQPWLGDIDATGFARLARSAERILELGAKQGELTCFLAGQFPEAEITAVEAWGQSAAAGPHHPRWISHAPGALESFSAAVWRDRSRVRVWKGAPSDALARLHRLGMRFDLIVVRPEYDLTEFDRTLQELQACYPHAVWVGTHWHWRALRTFLLEASVHWRRRLAVAGDLWRLMGRPT